jgi:hypothetical protein
VHLEDVFVLNILSTWQITQELDRKAVLSPLAAASMVNLRVETTHVFSLRPRCLILLNLAVLLAQTID